MQKVLAAEIGSESTVINAFGNLNTENPRLLGQGIYLTTEIQADLVNGLKSAIADLENDIGPVGFLGEIPFYVTSSREKMSAIQEVVEPYLNKGRILSIPEATMLATQIIYDEVGDVLVLDVGGTSTNVYSVTTNVRKPKKITQKSQSLAKDTAEEGLGIFINALPLVKLIGESRFMERHGENWIKLLKTRPESPEEMALTAELTAAAVSFALQRHSGKLSTGNGANCKDTDLEGLDLTRVRWIVGTGQALTHLPNGLAILRESIKGLTEVFSLPEEIAVFLDKECIMPSLGILTTTFRQGAWLLLRESFGVEN